MPMETPDKIDRLILRSLQVDRRATCDQISEPVGLGLRAFLNVRLEKHTESHKCNPMDTLRKHPSVEDCKTSFVLDHAKATTALPVHVCASFRLHKLRCADAGQRL